MSFRVVVAAATEADTQRWLQAFSRFYPQYSYVALPQHETDLQADYAVVWRPPEWLFRRCRGLRAVFNLGAGVDALVQLPALPHDLPVVRLEDAGMARQMVEYVVHGLLHASRQFGLYQQQQAQGLWHTLPAVQPSLWPVGVLGLGTIGAQVAQAVAALGYPVLGWSRSPRHLDGIKAFHGFDALPAFLTQTRVLVNVLPLTEETRGLLNAKTLGQLKKGAYLINVGRGAHLSEDDLLPLIDNGQLQGALLDVFVNEPLPAGHPFWRHPAIRITPHIAAITLEDEACGQIINKIIALENGDAITGVVALERGY